jgi:hypothetical protein
MFVPRSNARQQREARRLMSQGLTDWEVAHTVGLGRSTICRWRNDGFPTLAAGSAPLPADWRPPDAASYAYLLGVYLGDGCVIEYPRTFSLAIVLDRLYPGIIDECEKAIEATVPVKVSRAIPSGERSVRLVSYWRGWPLVFPQHGPGRKHERHIKLALWQRQVVDARPCQFLRGLIHSDGSRVMNRFTVELPSGPRKYSYPRYFFSNLSADIRGLFCLYCDQLEIRWTQSNYRNISVAHRRSVAILDSFVGPKE